MRIIEPSYEIMYHGDQPLQHIERIGRICYKSEHKITDNSADKLIRKLVRSGHMAMLEHYRFIVVLSDRYFYEKLMSYNPQFLMLTDDSKPIVSGSARGFYDLYYNLDHDDRYTQQQLGRLISSICHTFNCPQLFNNEFIPLYSDSKAVHTYKDLMWLNSLTDYELYKHGWLSVKFICDRGVSHELVRHRVASFAQESTRYCKYDNNVVFIKPLFYDEGSKPYYIWMNGCEVSEAIYTDLLDHGSTPQEARTVLNNSLKTEIVVTATQEEWDHIFDLRALDKTGKAHPQMKQIMLPLYNELTELMNNDDKGRNVFLW